MWAASPAGGLPYSSSYSSRLSYHRKMQRVSEPLSLTKLEQSLGLLACPACLEPLRPAPNVIACTGCGRVYPVLDGIPILLVDRATLPA